MKVKVSVYSDYMCPFCFLGKSQLELAVKELSESGVETEVDWKPYELRPLRLNLPPPPEEYLRTAWENVKSLSRAYNVEIRRPSVRSSSRLALEAAEYAKENGLFQRFHDEIFRAYFLKDMDIGQIQTVLEVGARVGLSVSELSEALQSGKYGERIDASRLEGESLNISGVPTFLVGGKVVYGAQPFEALLTVMAASIDI